MSKIDRLGRIRDDDDMPPEDAGPAAAPRRRAKRLRRDSESKALALPPARPQGPEWIKTLEAEVLRAAANLHDAEDAQDAAEKPRKAAADAARWARVALKGASTELASARRRADES